MEIYGYDHILETMVYKDKGGKSKHPIAIYPDLEYLKGFVGDPYFKYYYSQNTDKNNQTLLRISFLEPRFIVHYNMKDAWPRFNSSDKKELMDKLNKLIYSKHFPNKKQRVWDIMLYQLALELSLIGTNVRYDDIKNWEIPDYTKLPSI